LSPDRFSPEVSVVVATRNRAPRLRGLLDGIRAQTLDRDRFELIVVDDGSTDGTPALLEQATRGAEINLRAIRRTEGGGPAGARQQGWHQAEAPLIAFTDDDCVPWPDWLEQALAAARRHPGAIIQGSTVPAPAELRRRGPFLRTVEIRQLDDSFQTCNIVYPRGVLEEVGGFDTETFSRAPFLGGEDSDLGWRALKGGAQMVFASEAGVHHGVDWLGGLDKAKLAARPTLPMLAYARHPELREAHFVKGIFWKGSHYLLVRALLALVLPRKLRWLTPWFAGPYLLEIRDRLHEEGTPARFAPYLLAHDLVELVLVTRAAIRCRRLMI